MKRAKTVYEANEKKPVIVYLDQADWSHLRRGGYPEEESKLRRLGELGHAIYVISPVHLIETANNTDHLEESVRFLYEFPGACITFNSPYVLMQDNIYNLIDYVTDNCSSFRPMDLQLNTISRYTWLNQVKRFLSSIKICWKTIFIRMRISTITVF